MINQIDPSWNVILAPLFKDQRMKNLSKFLEHERALYQVYPGKDEVFNAFKLTPLNQLKVVILGQDPYHNQGQAHGLAFSVPRGIVTPPSLRNIFKELQNDTPGFVIPEHGDLTRWAQQGVLLLNATLTVRAHQAGSHQRKGWEDFTDAVIQGISENCEHIVFLLWGNYAIKKAKLIDARKHLLLTAVHPSPLSVYRGFFGCAHFSKTNLYLDLFNKQTINWSI